MNSRFVIPEGTLHEAELLLVLLRGRAAERARAEVLAASVDWGRLLDFAFRHRLTPQLRAALEAGFPGLLPDELAARLRENTDAISRNNLLLTSELLRLVALFESHGVPMMPLKGPTLAQRLYGNLAMRSFTDLDILVRSDDALRAMELLKSNGYAAFPPMTSTQERVFVRFEHDRNFRSAVGGCHLELHWRLFDRYIAYPIGYDGFWAGLRRERFLETEVRAMADEDLLIVLATHGSKHGWPILAWTLDIARLLASADLDWAAVLSRASRLRVRRMLAMGLRLAADLWAAELPAEALALASDPVAGRLATACSARLLVGDRQYLSPRESHRFLMAMRERLRDRVHYLWYWTFTPNDRDRSMVRLPASLAFLYAAVRPLRLAVGLVRRPLR